MDSKHKKTDNFIHWFRNTLPYVHAHRNKTFVVAFGGEAVADSAFSNLVSDLALLQALGIRLVLVHGARPQIVERLKLRQANMRYINGIRVTDDAALACVKEANGAVRVEIEALFSMGLTNSPMFGAKIRIASGNFVTARPIGVKDGIDYQHTGMVRRIDTQAISHRLDNGELVVLPSIGYSPTGEVFNLSAADVATQTAIEMNADKLILLHEEQNLRDSKRKQISNLLPQDLEQLLSRRKQLPEDFRHYLNGALTACRNGVERIHLLSRCHDGALLQELFTRDGEGTLLSDTPYEDIRTATIRDVGGILELLKPLEEKGVLVKRSREKLETEINHFAVLERDGMIVGCAAMYPFPQNGTAELACLAIHEDYRNTGRGDILLRFIEDTARQAGVVTLFALTTQTAHWFRERGFVSGEHKDLPGAKRALYNYRRNSKVLLKTL